MKQHLAHISCRIVQSASETINQSLQHSLGVFSKYDYPNFTEEETEAQSGAKNYIFKSWKAHKYLKHGDQIGFLIGEAMCKICASMEWVRQMGCALWVSLVEKLP